MKHPKYEIVFAADREQVKSKIDYYSSMNWKLVSVVWTSAGYELFWEVKF